VKGHHHIRRAITCDALLGTLIQILRVNSHVRMVEHIFLLT
jgi:hypothetical protein